MEMRSRVDAKFLVPGGGIHEPLGVAPKMQGKATPVSNAVEGHGDLFPLRAAHPPELGIEVIAHVSPQLIVVEGVGIVTSRSAKQVVSCLAYPPVGHEPYGQNAPVVSLVAVLIGRAPPRA